VSDAVRRWYVESFAVDPSTVVTIRNGLVAPEISEVDRKTVRAELGADPERVLAVTVSIMRAGKGHSDLLQAAALLPADMPVTLAFVGTGPEHDALVRQAREIGVFGDRVVFTGFRSDVARVFAAADLAIQASHFDALPTSLIHALAAGVPIVASRVGGIPEIVGSEAGVLVEPGDPEGFAHAIGRLVGDPGTRRLMGKKGRERFDEEFDGEVWMRRLRSVYDES
jgi:glycosyltransferase involved in cell wall biosynthesis